MCKVPAVKKEYLKTVFKEIWIRNKKDHINLPKTSITRRYDDFSCLQFCFFFFVTNSQRRYLPFSSNTNITSACLCSKLNDFFAFERLSFPLRGWRHICILRGYWSLPSPSRPFWNLETRLFIFVEIATSPRWLFWSTSRLGISFFLSFFCWSSISWLNCISLEICHLGLVSQAYLSSEIYWALIGEPRGRALSLPPQGLLTCN